MEDVGRLMLPAPWPLPRMELQATLAYAKRHPQVGADFAELLRQYND